MTFCDPKQTVHPEYPKYEKRTETALKVHLFGCEKKRGISVYMHFYVGRRQNFWCILLLALVLKIYLLRKI